MVFVSQYFFLSPNICNFNVSLIYIFLDTLVHKITNKDIFKDVFVI